jgi:hypothetical protein
MSARGGAAQVPVLRLPFHPGFWLMQKTKLARGPEEKLDEVGDKVSIFEGGLRDP